LEWEPNQRDAWVADAQRWICQIKGVLQCKIDLDPAGEIAGVHVVAGLDREPRHIVRDVESLLKARLQMDVYYKKIGVVQVMGNAGSEAPQDDLAAMADPSPDGVPGPSGVSFHPPGPESGDDSLGDLEWQDQQGTAVGTMPPPAKEPAPVPGPAAEPMPAVLVAEGLAPRITCGGVGVMASDMVVHAEVQLRAGEIEARGTREGPNHVNSDVHLVARAALDAVAELLVEPVLLHLKEIRLESLGGQDVVMIAVDLVEGRASDTLFGTCSTRHNRQQAVVHAVLDALNRRLSLYSLKPATTEG
jgi:hypothetical protein